MTPIILTFALLVSSHYAAADVYTKANMSRFEAVESLLPYRGAVVASPDSTYSVTLYAPKEITDRAQATVSTSRVLTFSLTGDKPQENETVSVYNYTVSVPQGSLRRFESQVATSLNINGTAADDDTFTFRGTGPTGSAKLKVTDLGSETVDVNATGFGSIYLGMTSEASLLDLHATGTGGANITGMTGTINANMDGLSNLAVGPSTDTLLINAFTTGENPLRVTYFTGRCFLITQGAGASCIQSSTTAQTTAG